MTTNPDKPIVGCDEDKIVLEWAKNCAQLYSRLWPGKEAVLNKRARHYKNGFLDGVKWQKERALKEIGNE